MDTTEPHDLPTNTLWHHRQSLALVRLLGAGNIAGVELVRRMNLESKAIRWSAREDFVRDYELVPEKSDA